MELTLIEMAQLSSDDGESSGLCPTKILKPIFKALKAPQSQKGEAVQNVSKQEKSNTPNPTTGNTSTNNKPVNTPNVQPRISPTPPGVGGLRFSLRRQQENSPKQQETTKQETVAAATFEDQPVNPMDLMVAWREFAKNLPQEDRAMSFQMDNMEPQLQEDGKTVLVVVDNPSVQSEVHKMQTRIETYLHQRLQNNSLTLTTRLREVTEKTRVLSRKEVLNQMLKQSEALRKLKEEFQLELA